MNRQAWLVFATLAVAAALGTLGFALWQKDQQFKQSEIKLKEMQETAEGRAARLAEAWQEVQSTRSRMDEALAAAAAAATNAQQRLETEMRSALASRDVAISQLQGELTVNILDRILFDSGEAVLKPEGMQVLNQVAGVLSRYTNRPVQVYGHTDNVPIRFRYPSNWELSAARALAAVRYLAENAGVDARRLSAVACGEFQPIADNATAEGRARNRRIALVVLPERFVPTDVPVTPEGNGIPGTNGTVSATGGAGTHSLPAGSATNPVPEDPVVTEEALPETDDGIGKG
jgi:chemotaxis protein MotB